VSPDIRRRASSDSAFARAVLNAGHGTLITLACPRDNLINAIAPIGNTGA